MNKSDFQITDFPIIFAPMEGITDETYRLLINDLYPDWDYQVTDFLRVTRTGTYKEKHIQKHYGKSILTTPKLKKKNIFQILTSYKAFHIDCVQKIESFDVKWLDLNLGCPSKTVCKSQGGSYLLSQLEQLRVVIREIRQNYNGFFSAKIRTGYENNENLLKIIELLNQENVDLITIHGRTREELYKGVANWQDIKRAKENSSVPIIANGDIWTVEDIHKIKEVTKCDGVMIARGALQSPWLAQDYYQSKFQLKEDERILRIKEYFLSFKKRLEENNIKEEKILRHLKGLSRYPFLPLSQGEMIRSTLLRSQTLPHFMKNFHSTLS